MTIKTELKQLFEDFNQLKVLVIGDVMVDSYYWGKVDRISPEAPVPIVSVEKRDSRLGGAANVALNIQALGATPILCSVIGKDDAGKEFLELVEKNNQSTEGLISSDQRRTTRKTRIIGNNHQMLRVDAEDVHPLDKADEKKFIKQIEAIIEQEKIDAIVFEDYDKGVISASLIRAVVKMAQAQNIPTSVDPKKRNFMDYHQVTLFKPNLKELKEGLKIDIDVSNQSELKQAIVLLESKLKNENTLITLSERGVFIHNENEEHHIPAHLRNITDVSGAGDTVISVATLCLAKGVSPKLMAELSNLAGGLVCENVGVVPINKNDLQKEAEKLLSENL